MTTSHLLITMIVRVDSKDVDRKKLSFLQNELSSDSFSQTAYFEALCPKWCLLVLRDYEGALIIPYNQKGPWQWVVTPLYYRASQWLGTWSDAEKVKAIELIQQEFSSGCLNLSDLPNHAETRNYQVIYPKSNSSTTYNSLAQRMIRKAENHDFNFIQELDIANFSSFLLRELGTKVDSVDSDSVKLLGKLLQSLNENKMLKFEGIVMGGELVAGLVVVELEGRHLYLKGTATDSTKKMGAFYALMHRAIQRAMSNNAIFDFGGSNVEGVAQFNRNFGAEDANYVNLSWGKQPTVLRTIKSIRKLWK